MIEMITGNKVVVLAMAFLVALGAWYVLGGSSGEEPVLVTEDFATPSSEADRDLVATLLQLRAVSLEGTVFSDPIFRSLKDFGSQIVPEPVGRPNPFAPLESQRIQQAGQSAAAPAAGKAPPVAPKQ